MNSSRPARFMRQVALCASLSAAVLFSSFALDSCSAAKVRPAQRRSFGQYDTQTGRGRAPLLDPAKAQLLLCKINAPAVVGEVERIIGEFARAHPEETVRISEADFKTAERIAWALCAACADSNLIGIRFEAHVGGTLTPEQVLAMPTPSFDCDEACLMYDQLVRAAGVEVSDQLLIGIQPPGSPTGHMVLVFRLGGRRWLVDLTEGLPPIRPIGLDDTPTQIANLVCAYRAAQPDGQAYIGADGKPYLAPNGRPPFDSRLTVRTYRPEEYVDERVRTGRMKP